MNPFTESLRYEYPLTPCSVVIDCGGYEGNFSALIATRYGCVVHCLEPVTSFRQAIEPRLRPFSKVKLHAYGIGGETREAKFQIKGDSTGEFAVETTSEIVQLRGIAEILADLAPAGCDLLKLNIEGAEFEVLETAIAKGLLTQVKNLQVQFHSNAPDAEARYERIRSGLFLTHHLTYNAPWCWQNFEINS